MVKTRTSGSQKNAGVSMGGATVRPKLYNGKWNLEGTGSGKKEQGIGKPSSMPNAKAKMQGRPKRKGK